MQNTLARTRVSGKTVPVAPPIRPSSLSMVCPSRVVDSLCLLLRWHCVSVPPKIAPFVAGPEPAFLGDYFALQCIITHGDQPVRIEWTVNNRSVKAIPGVRISNADRRSSVLTIESLEAKHAGLFNCTATNAAGVASHITELVVKGAALESRSRFRSYHLVSFIYAPVWDFSSPSSAVDSAVQFWRCPHQPWRRGASQLLSYQRRSPVRDLLDIQQRYYRLEFAPGHHDDATRTKGFSSYN